MRSELSAFGVEQEDGGRTLLLRGVIDENADLGFFTELHGRIVVNLKAVRRINSYGVRSWIEAIRTVPADAKLDFVECPPPVIDQVNMISGFLGRGAVSSFYAPMACAACGHEMDALLDVETCRRAGSRVPPTDCPRCNATMEVDDLEEQYLLFVRES
jgi:hypothetical protein